MNSQTDVNNYQAIQGSRIMAQSTRAGRMRALTVYLPAGYAGKMGRGTEADQGPVAVAPARRVLVVDDNRDSTESLALLLTLSGFETETAFDGVEAILKAGSWRPDVILLDIGLPGMSGYEVCRAIRAEPWGRELPVIALTGWGHADARRMSAEAGFTVHLIKPVAFPDLMQVLARVQPLVA